MHKNRIVRAKEQLSDGLNNKVNIDEITINCYDTKIEIFILHFSRSINLHLCLYILPVYYISLLVVWMKFCLLFYLTLFTSLLSLTLLALALSISLALFLSLFHSLSHSLATIHYQFFSLFYFLAFLNCLLLWRALSLLPLPIRSLSLSLFISLFFSLSKRSSYRWMYELWRFSCGRAINTVAIYIWATLEVDAHFRFHFDVKNSMRACFIRIHTCNIYVTHCNAKTANNKKKCVNVLQLLTYNICNETHYEYFIVVKWPTVCEQMSKIRMILNIFCCILLYLSFFFFMDKRRD